MSVTNVRSEEYLAFLLLVAISHTVHTYISFRALELSLAVRSSSYPHC